MVTDIKAERELLEVFIRERSRVEYLHEFEKEVKLRAKYASNLAEKNARISNMRYNILKVFDKEVIDDRLNGILLNNYKIMEEELMDDYFACKNCLGTHIWPDGTPIVLEDKVFCTIYPEIKNSESEDAIFCDDFLAYSEEVMNDYNKKLTYFNKKINELVNKEMEKK